MNVAWNVDDLKLYHEYPFRVTNFDAYLSLIYGKNIKVTCSKVHDYLCMDLYYSGDGKVKISMIKYFQKLLDAFPE